MLLFTVCEKQRWLKSRNIPRAFKIIHSRGNVLRFDCLLKGHINALWGRYVDLLAVYAVKTSRSEVIVVLMLTQHRSALHDVNIILLEVFRGSVEKKVKWLCKTKLQIQNMAHCEFVLLLFFTFWRQKFSQIISCYFLASINMQYTFIQDLITPCFHRLVWIPSASVAN